MRSRKNIETHWKILKPSRFWKTLKRSKKMTVNWKILKVISVKGKCKYCQRVSKKKPEGIWQLWDIVYKLFIVCVIFFSFNYTKNGLNLNLISQGIALT